MGHVTQLASLAHLFDDVPAGRENYESVTWQNQYPLNFCAYRWVQNVQVCDSSMEILPPPCQSSLILSNGKQLKT